MATTLIIPGQRVRVLEGKDASLEKFGLAVQTTCAVQVHGVARGAGAEETVRDAADDDVVELRFAGGVCEWIRVEDLRARVGRTARGTEDESVLRIPSSFSASTSATRGAAELVLEGLQLLKIDPVDALAGLAAREFIGQIEGRFEAEPGLYRLDEAGRRAGRIVDVLPSSEAPYLLFIHGTFLNNRGSFGKLYETPEWRELVRRYARDHILAFEHHTLSLSPAANALALAGHLPSCARLHLVTHSRGGLVGDLLCLTGLPEDALHPFERDRPTGQEDIAALKELASILVEKQLRVERFVRVACPARGTLLASERLDRYLSLLLNLIGLIPALEASEVYPFAKAAILAIIKQRTKPEVLPGLEAMMPGSPFIRLLNYPGLRTEADLAVVAGDVQGRGVFGRLGVLAADLFFRQDHDLVVDTASMYEGPERSRPAYAAFLQGPEIHHMAYFGNDVSRRRITHWLMHDEGKPVDGFDELKPEPQPELAAGAFRARAQEAPVVFLIPGLMATRLRSGEGRVWLSRAAVAAGSLQRLALVPGGGGGDVTPDGLVPAPYRRLIEHLQASFEVITFPYDWRRSVREAGASLAAEVRAELRRHNRPVHLLAHSTGGLAARAMIAQDRDVWDQLCSRGGRLVMLGTPNRGSYAALQLLAGSGRLAQMLAMLDPKGSRGAVAGIMRTFPGLVELLPDEPALEGWQDSWWKSPETQRLLSDAREMRVSLEGAVDPDHMCCVVGISQKTPCGIGIGEDGKLRFLGSDAGDSIVSSALASLPGVPTWYIAAAHGDIPRQPAMLGASVDLLLHGTTNALTASYLPGAAGRGFELPDKEPMLYPDEWELLAAALGATAPGRRGRETYPLRVSVVHGSLEHARYPVAVGHYQGDVMVGAERFLDGKLGGGLLRRYEMNLYPGDVGTAEAVLALGCKPPGGLVVGLGEVGEIAPEVITRGVTEAALRLALAVAEWPGVEDVGRGWRSAAFSTLLIGTGGGRALSIENSVAAIVKGAILANRILRERNLWDKVRIDEVEFIELYQDLATHAAHVVGNLDAHLRVVLAERERIEPAIRLEIREGALLERPVGEYATGWWRRLQVTRVAPAGSAPGAGALQFVLLTDRARVEENLEPTQRELVDRLVEKTIRDSFAQDLPATLYELLMPNSFKELAYEVANLQLVLDSGAAQYPWEMLAERDRNGVASPIAHRMGVLRQLKTPQGRARVQHARTNNALVIGEPYLENKALYPPLPGAVAEARAVAALLEANGYPDPVKLIQKDATALKIVDALFAREYRIVHIAAHGIYDRDHPEKSGVVIGDGIYLTSAELSKLRVVPELVFLNCCYLGKIDPGGEGLPPERQQVERAWSKLAASISEELIKMGVRAVVAAGWAVDDMAGKFFATEFYKEMLLRPGQQFGEAVWNARRQTYQGYATSSNTWGAYQCYGDPAFSFGRRATGGAAGRPEPVAAHEVVRELEEIRRRAPTSDLAARAADLDRARDLVRIMPAEWRNGKMLCALGAAFAELGEFKDAIASYEEALTAKGTHEEVPFMTLEQLANLKTRYALDLRRRLAEQRSAGAAPPGIPDPDEVYRQELLRDARSRLEQLICIVKTPQRLALIGATFKRLAQASKGSERRQALRRAEQCYREAHERQSQALLKVDPYYTLNWVTCSWLSARDLSGSRSKELRELIELSMQAVPEKAAREPGFWARVHVPDGTLLRALMEGDLEEHREEIIRLYQEVFRIGASPLERNSVSQQFDFLVEMMEWRKRAKVAQALRMIRDAIVA